MNDPHFVARTRLWARLFAYIPATDEADASRIAVDLNALYWDAIDTNGALVDALRDELATTRRQLAELEQLAAAPIERSH